MVGLRAVPFIVDKYKKPLVGAFYFMNRAPANWAIKKQAVIFYCLFFYSVVEELRKVF